MLASTKLELQGLQGLCDSFALCSLKSQSSDEKSHNLPLSIFKICSTLYATLTKVRYVWQIALTIYQYMKLYTCTYFFCAYQLLTSNWFTSMLFSQHKGERKRKIIQEEQERKFSSNNKEVNIYKEITCTWSRANVNPNLVKIKRRDSKK